MPPDDLDARLAQAQTTVAQTAGVILPAKTTPPAQARLQLATIVIWFYALFIAGVGIAIVWLPGICGDKVGALTEIIKVAVVPVVTFVIGHYFGARAEG